MEKPAQLEGKRSRERVVTQRTEAFLTEERGAGIIDIMAGVAQVVRAPGCGPGGRRFKSGRSPRSAGCEAVFCSCWCRNDE